MKSKNLRINAILNVTKSCLSIVFPLISAPYALRVIGASGVGKVSYVTSIVSYFSLLAMLGVSTYAVREGAKRRNNQRELEQFASEIFSINLFFTIIAYISLWIFVLNVERFRDYRLLFLILSLSMVFQTCSIDWMNTVFEDYLYITIRSIISYIINSKE